MRLPNGFEVPSHFTTWHPNGLEVPSHFTIWHPNGLEVLSNFTPWHPNGLEVPSHFTIWYPNPLEGRLNLSTRHFSAWESAARTVGDRCRTGVTGPTAGRVEPAPPCSACRCNVEGQAPACPQTASGERKTHVLATSRAKRAGQEPAPPCSACRFSVEGQAPACL